MTATFTDRNLSITWGHSGDHMARYRAENPRLLSDPFAVGTLWERVNESGVGRDSELYFATLRTVRPRFTLDELADGPIGESIPERTERIIHEQNIGFGPAVRVALAESRLERAKAAHPAGKGITHEEVQ